MVLEVILKDVSNRPSFSAQKSIRQAILLIAKSKSSKKQTKLEDNLLEKEAREKDTQKKPSSGPLSRILKRIKKVQKSEEKEFLLNPNQEQEELRVMYGLMEEQQAQLDYQKLFSYLGQQAAIQTAYQEEAAAEKKEERKGAMDDGEAQKFVEREQVNKVLKDGRVTNFQEKERFHWWQMFNAAKLMFYHSSSVVQSAEVDYAKMN